MSDVTQILSQIESGDPSAAEHLLPLVYHELRRLAVAKLARENPDQTLNATALVHEAYIRLEVDARKLEKARAHIHSLRRLFYIWDEGPLGLTDARFSAKWSLVQDAK